MNRIKKAVCILGAGAALATTSAFARDDYRQRGEGYRDWHHRPAPVEHRRYASVARPYYAHRYVERAPVAYYPQPGYYAPPAYGVMQVAPGAVIGAAAGAMIGSQLGDRHNRAATTAIGALLGGFLGSQME